MSDGRSLPDWELEMVEEAIREAERRLDLERSKAKRRAVQLAREQGYHRLAIEIDRPHTRKAAVATGQLSFFPTDPTLFEA